MSSLIMKYLIVGTCILIGVVSVYVFNLPEDNPVEETAELIIYHHTGHEIDITPDLSEKDDDENISE